MSEYTTYCPSGRYADRENTGEDRLNLETTVFRGFAEFQASITKVKGRAKCNVQVDLCKKQYDDVKY